MTADNLKIKLFILVILFSGACDRNRNHPGWDYFPDMFYSTAYESNTANPNFKDGMTMRTPAEGSIPQDYIPFDYSITPEDRARAGNELDNPLSTSSETIERGREIYTSFCSGCHGIKGSGDGWLYTSKLYPVIPRSLVNENAGNLKDGEIFHTITLGFGSMGPHGSQVRTDDRWKVILYIRKLQQETN